MEISTTMVSTLLWLPFLVCILITALIFGFSGKNHGFWRALFGLIAVILAALVSIPISRMIAGGLSSMLVNIMSDSGMAAIEQNIVSGALGSIVSMCAFSFIMLVATIVFRLLAIRIREDLFEPYEPWEESGGIAVGIASAVLFTLLLLSPIYTSLSIYVPVVEKVSVFMGGDETDIAMIEEYTQVIEKNPVVRMSGTAPVTFVYGEVSKFAVDDAAVNVVELVDATDKLMNLLYAMETASDEERRLLCIEAAVLVRDEFVETDWLYDLVQEMIDEQRKQLVDLTLDEMMIVETMLSIVDVPQDVFEENCRNIMDFGIFILEQDLLTALEMGDVEQLRRAGTMSQLGWLLNSTEQAVELKRMLIADLLYGRYFDDIQSIWAFINKYNVGLITDPAMQEKEAELFALMFFSGSNDAENFVRNHPNMGPAAWHELQRYG